MTFMTHADIDDMVVYEICKALFDHPEELDPIHPNFKHFSRTPASPLVTVPYHPGAIKYYKEKGYWTSEIDSEKTSIKVKRKCLRARLLTGFSPSAAWLNPYEWPIKGMDRDAS
jgi:hypothetical protein